MKILITVYCCLWRIVKLSSSYSHV